MKNFTPLKLSRNSKSKSNYYEFYSLKNMRNVQIFSQHEYHHSIMLEMNSDIQSYCERPISFNYSQEDNNTKRIMNFAVEIKNNNQIEMQRLISYINSEIPPHIQSICNKEKLWCNTHNYKYQIYTLSDVFVGNYYIHNVKFLYYLMKHTNSPIYNKYIDSIIKILRQNKSTSIEMIMLECNLTANDIFKTIAFGIYQGIFKIDLSESLITYSTEVQLN